MPFAALPGVKLHFVQLPSRAAPAEATDDVVMIHGLATSMGFWYPGVAPFFTRLGPVTLYDLRGHGRSEMRASGYSPAQMAEDLRALLDHLELERVHIVAHSFGGSVALSFALLHPQRVRSLVLADVRIPSVQRRLAFAEWPQWEHWRDRFGQLGIEVDEQHPESGLLLLTALARLQVARVGDAPAAHGLLGELGRLKGRRAALRWLQLLETTAAHAEMTSGVAFEPDELSRLEQPILALIGEHTFTLASANALRSHCRQCHVEVVPRAGHFFPISRPIAFSRRCGRFYASHFLTSGAAAAGLLAAGDDDDGEENEGALIEA